MKMKLLLLGTALGAMTACAPPTTDEAAPVAKQPMPIAAPAPVDANVGVEATTKEASIDWAKAKQDMIDTADQRAALPTDTIQVQSGGSAPPVPVLLPTGIVTVASEGNGPSFQPLSDGYFAAYPGEKYDIIVNGTNQVIGTATGGSARSPDREMRFQDTLSGAQVSFSRYGADYLVQFECKEVSGEQASCIGRAKALKITEDLLIAGTR